MQFADAASGAGDPIVVEAHDGADFDFPTPPASPARSPLPARPHSTPVVDVTAMQADERRGRKALCDADKGSASRSGGDSTQSAAPSSSGDKLEAQHNPCDVFVCELICA